MALDSMQEIFDKIQAGRKPFWQVVRDTDVEERQVTAEASFEKMHATWRAMVESVDTYRADRRSVSGLVGGDAQRMWDYAAQQETLCGPYLQEVIATALCVAESNACMHRIVAAPTAGACGVLPAVLVPLYRRGAVDEEAIVRALYVAAGIGAVVGYRASISGASGGCQAEVGTAAAMAAGALVDLRGGGPEQIGHAVAMALKNLMGLVCDPVAGLVEVPCVKRNVIGACGPGDRLHGRRGPPAAGRAAGDRSGRSRRHTIRTEREGKAGRAPLPGTGAVRTKEGPALRQVLLFAKGKIRRSGWPGLSGTSPCRLQSGRPKSSPHSRRRS